MRFGWIATGVYGLILCVLVVSLFSARRQAMESFGTTQAKHDWENWRAAASRQDGASTPVERRVPSSPEPPTLVLLRDHFAVILAATMLITSAVYWAFAIMLRGAIWGPSFDASSASNGINKG